MMEHPWNILLKTGASMDQKLQLRYIKKRRHGLSLAAFLYILWVFTINTQYSA